MRTPASSLVLALLLFACGDRADAPASMTAIITVTAEGGVTTVPVSTVLAVEKRGRPPLVDASAEATPPGGVSGRHNFPPGVTAPAIAAYYEGLLRNNGWTEADVRVDRGAGRLEFHGVPHLRGGAVGNPLEVRIETRVR